MKNFSKTKANAFKIIVVGDRRVGKSNIVTRFTQNEFSLESSSSPMINIYTDMKIKPDRSSEQEEAAPRKKRRLSFISGTLSDKKNPIAYTYTSRDVMESCLCMTSLNNIHLRVSQDGWTPSRNTFQKQISYWLATSLTYTISKLFEPKMARHLLILTEYLFMKQVLLIEVISTKHLKIFSNQ
eukprot:CAMPEP_0196999846 /NCGR_PEP_ID=MMETSP1380-20130617/4941_1 /TAXON_ID=5936 /ORGANISM="Euplotes crassus, Strain CT5" /LENGTH=182 /DNA_ID=CAMNT_0042416919 /DNA_START=87 /DNA_END=636 /DNA_ORIENTATION=+